MKRSIFFRFAGLLCCAALLFAGCRNDSGAPETEEPDSSGTPVSAHTHEWGEWKILRAATCTGEGISAHTCTSCGETENLPLAAVGHSVTAIPGREVNCTESGLTDGARCPVCGEILVEQTTVPAKGHHYVNNRCEDCGKEVDGEGLEFASSADGAAFVVIGIGSCTDREIIIPSVRQGKPVIGIADSAFQNCSQLTRVTVGNHVTFIGNSAFEGCKDLTHISIPESVTAIGSRAFASCVCLKTAVLERSEWSVPDTEITVPDAETAAVFLTKTYCDCNWSRSAASSGHVHMWEWAPVQAPTCTEEGRASRTCTGCGKQEEWNLPVTRHRYVHDVCATCGAARFSEGLSFQLNEAGSAYILSGIGNCTDNEVIIPSVHQGKPVIRIGKYAFAMCENLIRIRIPESITEIESHAFARCNNLTEITVAEGNARYRSAGNCIIETGSKTLIAGCKNSVIPTDGSVTCIGESAFVACHSLTAITIPGTVTFIGNSAFDGCINLISIAIPNSVTFIGNFVFASCNAMESLIAEGGNPVYHSTGNCLIETQSGTLIAGCKNSVIPTGGSVTKIGKSAFYNCDSLTAIRIPEGVGTVEDFAFAYCSYLTDVSFPRSVTKIGRAAFWGCERLAEIRIPESVTVIGNNAFADCGSLVSIEVEEGNSNYHSAGNCLIETGSKTLLTGCRNSVIPADGSVTCIGAHAFSGCRELTDIVIPESVTVIGYYAFFGCKNLRSVTFAIPAGWIVSPNLSIADGKPVMVPDSTAAAKYLTDMNMWCACYWTRQ